MDKQSLLHMWNISCYSVIKQRVNSGGKAVPTPHVAHIVQLFFTNPVISHESRKDQIEIRKNGTYSWSQIFRNG